MELRKKKEDNTTKQFRTLCR